MNYDANTTMMDNIKCRLVGTLLWLGFVIPLASGCSLGTYTKTTGEVVCPVFVYETFNHSRAVMACRSMGGSLPVIRSQSDQNAVYRAAKIPLHDLWAWLYASKRGGTFFWRDDPSDPVNAGYTNWKFVIADYYEENEDCVEMTPDGTWNDRACYNPRQMLCEIPTMSMMPCTSEEYKKSNGDIVCAVGLPELFYDYEKAKQFCHDIGGSLPVVRSQSDHFNLLTKVIQNKVLYGTWLYASDRNIEGTFLWRDDISDPVDSGFTNWDRKPPDYFPLIEEDCAYMDQLTGKWDDRPCKSRSSFLCEKVMRKPPPPKIIIAQVPSPMPQKPMPQRPVLPMLPMWPSMG